MRPSELIVVVACEDPRLRGRIAGVLSADSISQGADARAPADLAVLAFDLAASNPITDLRAAVRELQVGGFTVVSPDCGPLGARRAVREGVAGIVLEDEMETTLAPAVRAVAAGLTAVPVRLRTEADKLSLSRRELDVLRLVAAGKTNHEIALALFLAESTVKSHITSLFRKVGVDSRSEIARLALDPEEGLTHLITPTPMIRAVDHAAPRGSSGPSVPPRRSPSRPLSRSAR